MFFGWLVEGLVVQRHSLQQIRSFNLIIIVIVFHVLHFPDHLLPFIA
jgi:hypothetical protein